MGGEGKTTPKRGNRHHDNPLSGARRMKRHKPLRRSGAPVRKVRLQRKKRLAPVNRERRARAFAKSFNDPGFVAWVQSLGCSVPGCRRTDIEAAHVDAPRSRGGDWTGVAPLCAPHHERQEKRTDAFNAEHGVDLYLVAAAVAQRWMAFAGVAA